MSKMIFEKTTYSADVEILSRSPFEGVSTSMDFTSVTDTNAKGKKIVKAGTPIGATGVVDNTATVEGILLHDVTEDRPVGTILKKAYINTAVAEAHSGVTIAQAVKDALPMVVFE